MFLPISLQSQEYIIIFAITTSKMKLPESLLDEFEDSNLETE